MVAGSLRIKKGYYYIVLSYNVDNKRVQKWIATRISSKDNKRKANELLSKYKNNYNPVTEKLEEGDSPQNIEKIGTEIKVETNYKTSFNSNNMLFCDYMLSWLESVKGQVEQLTYLSYKRTIDGVIYPYFKKKRITLLNITPNNIEEFYKFKSNTCKANTIVHYHAYIRKALQTAFIAGTINYNPADKVKKPKVEQFIGSYYNTEELNELFGCIKGHRAELPILIAAYYGLRRSEIIGLKWDAIDFYYKTITVKHTVTSTLVDGKTQLFYKDRGKSKKSYRTLPLMPTIEQALIILKEKQSDNRYHYKKRYSKDFLEYIFVDDLGNLTKPNNLSKMFKQIITENNLKKVRFHDLRHSCATLLRHEGVPLEDIQKWLGHSDIKTTENTYAHFDNTRHLRSANKILTAFESVENRGEAKKDDEMEL